MVVFRRVERLDFITLFFLLLLVVGVLLKCYHSREKYVTCENELNVDTLEILKIP